MLTSDVSALEICSIPGCTAIVFKHKSIRRNGLVSIT